MKRLIALAASVTMCMVGAYARADIVKVEATLKSVDAAAKSITVQYQGKSITLDVSRKASITFNGASVTLDEMAPGLKVAIEYETQFEIVTQLRASGEGQAKSMRELVVLSEINGNGGAMDPWVSPDGLTMYWSTTGSVWTAKRKDAESFFEEKQELMRGRHPTVSGDGLQMILLSKRTDGRKGETLWVTSRASKDDTFRRPSEIRELKDQPAVKNPALSHDGLTLVFNRGNGEDVEVAFSTRRSAGDAWATPETLPIDWNGPGRLTWGTVSEDGKYLFCVVEGDPETKESGMLRRFSRSKRHESFANPTTIQYEGMVKFPCRSPRYIEATNELAFARMLDGKWGLCILKGFAVQD